MCSDTFGNKTKPDPEQRRMPDFAVKTTIFHGLNKYSATEVANRYSSLVFQKYSGKTVWANSLRICIIIIIFFKKNEILLLLPTM